MHKTADWEGRELGGSFEPVDRPEGDAQRDSSDRPGMSLEPLLPAQRRAETNERRQSVDERRVLERELQRQDDPMRVQQYEFRQGQKAETIGRVTQHTATVVKATAKILERVPHPATKVNAKIAMGLAELADKTGELLETVGKHRQMSAELEQLRLMQERNDVLKELEMLEQSLNQRQRNDPSLVPLT